MSRTTPAPSLRNLAAAPAPINLASRMASIEPFHVVELMERARALEQQGRNIIHMEVGEPDFGTPAPVIQAATQALQSQSLGYTSALGTAALREAISNFYQTRFKANVPAERIIVTSGASAALLIALSLLVSPEDEVLLTDPGYPCNRHFVSLLNGTPICMPLDHTTAYQPTSDHVAKYWSEKTRALLLATPSNPTGTCISPEILNLIAEAVKQRRGNLVVDEIYNGLAYDLPASTILSYRQDAFVINSFSKYWGMTGWRLGWLVVPAGYERDAEKLAQNLFISPPTLAQHAALACFHEDTLEEMEMRRLEFQKRRDLLINGLNSLGFGINAKPSGAFYVYANVSGMTQDSYTFSLETLEKTGVAMTPGLDFGAHAPDQHVRFAYTTHYSQIEQALERLFSHLRS